MNQHPKSPFEQSIGDRSADMSNIDHDHFLNLGNLHIDSGLVLGFLGFVALIVLALVVSNDASRRGRSGIFWGLATVFMPLITVPIYLILSLSDSHPGQHPVSNPLQQSTIEHASSSPQEFTVSQPVSEQSNEKVVRSSPEEETEQFTNEITKQANQFCTTCGEKNTLNAIYCNKCGNKVVS